jgi:hypothetical protein
MVFKEFLWPKSPSCIGRRRKNWLLSQILVIFYISGYLPKKTKHRNLAFFNFYFRLWAAAETLKKIHIQTFGFLISLFGKIFIRLRNFTSCPYPRDLQG